MRPVRFVALSEDGQALVLADEVGRLLALPIDDRLAGALRHDRTPTPGQLPIPGDMAALSPRDIQARIRSGESADDVARIANVPVDRVLRYAGPVLQERAMLAQHARRTRLRTSDRGASLAEVVDARLSRHGVDAEKVSWDAYRKDDGIWRVLAIWPSGKATAQATWELDKARQVVTPVDDMAHYLGTEQPTQILGQDPVTERYGHDPVGPARRDTRGESIRSSRDALLASLDRPLGTSSRGLEPAGPAERPKPAAPAAANTLSVSAFAEDDMDAPKDVPAVPSLAVLRPRRTSSGGAAASPAKPAAESPADAPRKRLPSWDDVLFGGGPTGGQASS